MNSDCRTNAEIPGILLWDVDGTLTQLAPHSQDKHHAAVARIMGIEVPPHMSWSGQTDGEIVHALMRSVGTNAPETSLLDQIFDELNRLTQDELIAHPLTPASGSRQLLMDTQQLGWINAVATGNTFTRARLKISNIGLHEFFDTTFFFTGENALNRDLLILQAKSEMHIRQHELPIVVIGDTPQDIKSSQAAGIPVISVATGKFDLETLAALNPDLLIRDLTEGRHALLQYLKTLEPAR